MQGTEQPDSSIKNVLWLRLVDGSLASSRLYPEYREMWRAPCETPTSIVARMTAVGHRCLA